MYVCVPHKYLLITCPNEKCLPRSNISDQIGPFLVEEKAPFQCKYWKTIKKNKTRSDFYSILSLY